MSSNFLKYFESEIKGNGEAKFKTVDDNVEVLKFKTIADSAYDQTFKRLFSGDIIMDNVSGEERLKSNENAEGKLQCDIACRCTCWKGEEEDESKNKEENVFDVEMQTGYDGTFVSRLFDYGISLRYNKRYKENQNEENQNEENQNKKKKKDHKQDKKKKNKKPVRIPVKILSFLNYKSKDNNVDNQSYKTTIKFVNKFGNIIGTLENPPVEIYAVNLPYEIEKLLDGESINFDQTEMNKTEKEWIKLLGLRHWATVDEHPFCHKYIIPEDMRDSDQVIQSAIKILEKVTETELQKYINSEAAFLGQLKTAEEKGIKIGEKRNAYKICENLLNKNMNIEDIADSTELSVEEVYKIKESLDKRRKLN
ncbi:hypothetical protein PIROE2DRAFT_3249 [Piromyces sp. E2]|nr:hypothetical protein PIROE2DRAFT_3249 [Piromyces sp. E2]|eukprot:OUM69007.1 hypothetical protein PIROE2DRAFT_3249 [Piromyces sp. E2]